MDDKNVAKIVNDFAYSDSIDRINKIMAKLPEIPHVPMLEQLTNHSAVIEAQRVANELSGIYTSLPSLSSTAQNILAEMTYNLSELSALKARISVLSEMDIINASAAAIGSLNNTILSQDTELSVDLPEPLVDLISTIDDSVELPEADSGNTVCVKESSDSTTFWNVVGLIISIIGIVLASYSDHSASTLEKQHHVELMQEIQKQTAEEERQTQEKIKHTEILKQILESITSDSESNTEPAESSTPKLL